MSKKKSPAKKNTMFILLSRWTEPCDGNSALTANLTEVEATRVENLIDWLEQHAQPGTYGNTLCEWTLQATAAKSKKADLDGLEAVLNEIALNSRYNETEVPGDYYGGNTHPDLNGR